MLREKPGNRRLLLTRENMRDTDRTRNAGSDALTEQRDLKRVFKQLPERARRILATDLQALLCCGSTRRTAHTTPMAALLMLAATQPRQY